MLAAPVRKFAATNRLAEMIGLPGGSTVRGRPRRS
jgi:hypothetical protein